MSKNKNKKVKKPKEVSRRDLSEMKSVGVTGIRKTGERAEAWELALFYRGRNSNSCRKAQTETDCELA